jgi:hypothetical protein
VEPREGVTAVAAADEHDPAVLAGHHRAGRHGESRGRRQGKDYARNTLSHEQLLHG